MIFLSYVCLKRLRLTTHKFIMATLDLAEVIAYNVKLREKDTMEVNDVIKTPITKEGVKTGKFRYRLAGIGSDGTGMSRFINEVQAKEASTYFGLKIEERAAKTATRKKKSCKQIGEDAEERCNVTRTAKKAPAKEKAPVKKTVTKRAPAKAKKAPAKKAPAKKAPAKKAPAKKPAAKKAPAKAKARKAPAKKK